MAIERFNAAFKRWFGKSVVVNDDGSPRVMYHGTKAPEAFTTFRIPATQIGVHVGTVYQAADFVYRNERNRRGIAGRRIYPLYVSIQNPLRLPDLGTWHAEEFYMEAKKQLIRAGVIRSADMDLYIKMLRTQRKKLAELVDKIKKTKSAKNKELVRETLRQEESVFLMMQREEIADLRGKLVDKGYDGIVYENTNEGWSLPDHEWKELVAARKAKGLSTPRYGKQLLSENSYIVWNQAQLKSATGNRGTWSMKDPDILHGFF